MAIWPSGKAEDCKSFIPSSNLGIAFLKILMAKLKLEKKFISDQLDNLKVDFNYKDMNNHFILTKYFFLEQSLYQLFKYFLIKTPLQVSFKKYSRQFTGRKFWRNIFQVKGESN